MKAAEAAALLLSARTSGKRLEGLPPHCRPITSEEVYAIHDELLKHLPEVGGWKVGGGPDFPPVFAPLFAEGVYQSGQELSADQFPSRLIEIELGFRALGAVDDGSGQQDGLLTGFELVLLIEVLNGRYKDLMAVSRPELLADSNAHGAMIIGETVPFRRHSGEHDPKITVLFDDYCPCTFTAPTEPAFRRAEWLVTELARRGRRLGEGQIIATGTSIAPSLVARRAEALSGHLGKVTVTFV
jgi:2-keto-4-pentenoate hydratase